LNWGAIFRFNTDDKNELTWTYPEEKAIHKVYVSEILTTIPELTTSAQGTITGNLIVLDTELTPELKAKNLIVVGGSAVNRVAADLLGLSYPTYGSNEAWQRATGVSGEGTSNCEIA
jgi:S-layer protein (TIGR01564 family)